MNVRTTIADEARSLAGRHALVTGASRGIGAAIAVRLAALGANVTLLGRDRAALVEVARGLQPAPSCVVVADVTDPGDMTRAFVEARNAFGPVQLLVNNAGQAASAAFHATDLALWRRMLSVNLDGTYLAMHAAMPDMQAAGYGRIVNIASIAALKGYAYVAAYCAAKHAVVGLTRAVALEAAKQGITVNAVCPGYTDTDLVREAVGRISEKTGRSAAQAREMLSATNPQGRLFSPEEVAHTVAWLCAPGTEGITGQCIAVSGGES